MVAQAWTRLRQEFPDLDVQIVSAGNTVYLLPTVLRSAPRGDGVRSALRRVNRATKPGAVLVDGGYVGDVVDLGPHGVVEAVRAHLGVAG